MEQRTSARTSRRAVCAGAVVALAALFGPRMTGHAPCLSLDGLVGDRRTAARMGMSHLLADPSAWQRLAALESEILAASSPQRLRASFRARRERELRQEEIAVVDGWVLARSEADLLALIALA